MSKLILLISLMMSFTAIKAYALSGEDKIKADCYKKTGSYGGSNPKSPYQLCLRANGVVRVERNVSGRGDKSKTDARICNAANPVCSKCIGLYGSGDAKSARTKITECIKREDEKQSQQAQQPKPKPKAEPKIASVTPLAPCSKTNPRNCTTMATCETNNGVWDGQACAAAPCPSGTTPDPSDSKYCVCDNEANPYSIERGSSQQCPAMCKAEDHKIYNIVARGCVCTGGFEDRTGLGICVSNAAPQPQVAACIQELQDKVTSCNTASAAAVDKCDPKRKSSGGDGLDALQTLLQGATVVGGGAADNCGRAAVAGSTGYYAIEELRGKCDTEINTCKTSCEAATQYLHGNKDRIYQKCRAKAWDDHQCAAPSATPYRSFTEDAFNIEWDGVNKALFEQQIQQMQTSITDYNSRCESGGTADSNRDKMTGFMDDMNTAFKGASQCECQLNPGSSNCANQVGPAECAGNPSLPGCAQATVNCLSATDTSPKCICFKNPNSEECKKIQQGNNLKINSTNVSSFAGVGGGFGGSGSGSGDVSGKTEPGNVNVGDLSGLGADGEVIGANASGTATADGGSPFGTAAGGGGSAGGGSTGGGGASGATAAEANGEDETTGKKIGGFFDVAKSALGNLFKKGKDDKGTYDPVTGKYIDGANANGLDSKKWRPRGMVRGLAGDTEIAGKFEDIWKVMNRQYKIQDQKDTFLFGGEKK